MKYLLIILIIFISGCKGEKVKLPNKEYIISYASRNMPTAIKKINFALGNETIIRDKQDRGEKPTIYITKLFSVNSDIILAELIDDTMVYDIGKNKVIKFQKDLSVYGYLPKYKLFLGAVYESKISTLYLMDLNFNRVKFITDNISQFSNLVIDDDTFIFTVNIDISRKFEGRYPYSELWLYNVKTNTKKRLLGLEKSCESLVLYRKATNQIVCKTDGKVFLTDINGNNIKYLKNIENPFVMYYDENIDSVFLHTTKFDISKMGETRNLELYDFKTQTMNMVQEDIAVSGMDIAGGK